ncbi:winged helix-turn-helix domain-containing protein [Micromonospora citrea]|uniref:winged helix-turn-helix domain-containing protein n=1 Tax=Micromonospora citrea TaxID=47855 RepID=UPI003C5EA0D3
MTPPAGPPVRPARRTGRVGGGDRPPDRARRAPGRDRRPRPAFGDGRRTPPRCTSWPGGKEIPLTRIEFDLLLFLAEHPHRVFTRLQLLAGVRGHEYAVARTVDVQVRRLRAKLAARTPVVTTVYGVGYRLADDARIRVDRFRRPAAGAACRGTFRPGVPGRHRPV